MEKVFETPFSSAGVAPAPGLCRLGVQFCSKAYGAAVMDSL